MLDVEMPELFSIVKNSANLLDGIVTQQSVVSVITSSSYYDVSIISSNQNTITIISVKVVDGSRLTFDIIITTYG
jgi:hypothetical protein